MIPIRSIIYTLVVCITLTGCQEQSQQDKDHLVAQTLYTAVSHPDRPEKDKQRDHLRKPAEVLEFLGVTPGMEVMEIMAASGYYTELLSRVVGDNGKVYSQNNKMYYEFQSEKLIEERLADNRLPNVIRWDRELYALDVADNSLDALFLMVVYHDFYWHEESPEQIVKGFYKALKPGGILAIVDHSAKANTGIEHAKDLHGLHRIDEQYVKKVMTDAGFIFDSESNILRNPNDKRDKAFFDEQMKDKPTDRFVHRYRKPEKSQ